MNRLAGPREAHSGSITAACRGQLGSVGLQPGAQTVQVLMVEILHDLYGPHVPKVQEFWQYTASICIR